MADEHEKSGKSKKSTPTAGIIIIGDEILKGHTKDLNSYFLVRRLWSLGVKVRKISVTADEEDDILHEVREFSSKFTFVITTGGIGPTHDDITISSIAKAFNENLVENEELVDCIASIYKIKKSELNEFHLRMAKLPPSSDLVYCKNAENNPFPVIRVRNVYVFPGVPDFLERDFQGIEHVFSDPSRNKFHLCKMYLSIGEAEIAHLLNEVHEKFKGTVQLGSYPDFCGQDYQVKLTLESESEAQWREACQYLLAKLPQDCVVTVEGLPLNNEDTGTNLI
jgi:FAD synthetase